MNLVDYEVGYGKPPKRSRFQKGVCPNPRGRGRPHDLQLEEILNNVLNSKVEFRYHGKLAKAPRIELIVRKLVTEALKGNLNSAALLLTMRAHAAKYGDAGPQVMRIINGLCLPEHD